MKIAIYSHQQPSNAMLALVSDAVGPDDEVITNVRLPIPHTQYVYKDKKKSHGVVWNGGADQNPTHHVNMNDLPFNWLASYGKAAGMITALAKDSDRILLMFPQSSEILPIYPFMAMAHNKTVRVCKGGTIIPVTLDELKTPATKKQYDDLILPPLTPIPKPTELMTTPNGCSVRPYQQQMINFGLEKSHAGLFVDMGLGKTLATLVLIDEWVKREEIDPSKPILIVAPIMVALDTWSREVEKWGYDWDIKINIRLTPKKREALLTEIILPHEKVTLFVTNPAQLEAIKDFYYSHNIPLPFEVLIIDELSMFKSPTSKRVETVKHFRKRAVKFLGLTGTPAPNNLLDVWSQIKIINNANTEWAGDTIYQFQDRYFSPVVKTPQGFVRKWKPKDGAEPVIYRHLSKNVISMQTKGLLELPPITYSDLSVTMPLAARKEYDTLETEIASEVDEAGSASYMTDDGFELRIPNNDVLRGKLLQIAGGALYTNTQAKTFDVFHDEKLVALENLIESASSPMLVAYYFESDFIRIQKKFKNSIPSLDSKDPNVQNVIERWNNGEIPVLLVHPASVGHGLNLQDGPGHTVVWFSLPNWNSDQYQQLNKRLHRSGQDHAVNVIHILTKNTIDGVMMRSLVAKAQENDKLMSTLDLMER